MKVQINHTGRVRNGKLLFDIQEMFNQQVLELEGKNFTLIIKEQHQKPTMSQYGYYRGCILPVCFESEMFKHMDKKDDVHDDFFAPRFLSYKKLVTINDKTEEQTKIRSLAELSKEEMSIFMEKVIATCQAELGVDIPPPEMFYSRYYKK